MSQDALRSRNPRMFFGHCCCCVMLLLLCYVAAVVSCCCCCGVMLLVFLFLKSGMVLMQLGVFPGLFLFLESVLSFGTAINFLVKMLPEDSQIKLFVFFFCIPNVSRFLANMLVFIHKLLEQTLGLGPTPRQTVPWGFFLTVIFQQSQVVTIRQAVLLHSCGVSPKSIFQSGKVLGPILVIPLPVLLRVHEPCFFWLCFE